MIPTQSAVRAYDVSHLTEHAAHWRELAERRRSVVGTINAQAKSLDWHGQGDEAMKAAMVQHLSTADDEAGLLDAAAQTAEGGASVLHQQQQSILSSVDQARQQGFAVGEDWSVTDAMYPPGSMGWYARLPTAQAHTADLRTQAGQFMTTEYQTAADVTQAAGDLGGEGAVRGHIKAVGNQFKIDGGPGSQNNQGGQPPNPFVPPAQPSAPNGSQPPAAPSGLPKPLQDFTQYQLNGQAIPNPPAPNVTPDQLRQQIINQRLEFRQYVEWFNKTYGGNVSPQQLAAEVTAMQSTVVGTIASIGGLPATAPITVTGVLSLLAQGWVLASQHLPEAQIPDLGPP